MGARGARRVTTVAALLRLARISNLPTVWSNVLAASVLAGGIDSSDLAVVLLAMSALYTGGMILNDAFDQEFDKSARPERPLPSGAISPATVWTSGGALLIAGFALLASFGGASGIAGLALVAAILIYDAWHKGNPISPLIMGLCRALVYIGTALAAAGVLSAPVLIAALVLFTYVAGLTQLAKHEVASVGMLIAAIALVDAAVAAVGGNVMIALLCIGLFLLTLALQRVVSGT